MSGRSALLVALAPADAAPALEGAADVGAHLVDGAEEARSHAIGLARLEDERRAVALVEAEVATIAQEVGVAAGAFVHAVEVAAEDADVLGQGGEAARPAGRALGDAARVEALSRP